MGAHIVALDEGVLLVPLDLRYIQVGFNLISVQVCLWNPMLVLLINVVSFLSGCSSTLIMMTCVILLMCENY